MTETANTCTNYKTQNTSLFELFNYKSSNFSTKVGFSSLFNVYQKFNILFKKTDIYRHFINEFQ